MPNNTSLPRRAAPVVLHYSRKPVPRQTVPPVADGDRTAILHNVTGVTLPAGQLWERVAEASAQAVAS